MYDKNSASRDVLDDIMTESAIRGHTTLDCGIRYSILSLLDEHGSADTLDGWIKAAREQLHFPSFWAMAWIYCHRYLREQFSEELLVEILDLSLMEPNSSYLINYVAGGQGVLPCEIEGRLLPVPRHYLRLFEEDSHFHELVGDF